MDKGKVLLVDDEHEFTEVLGERLGDRGFNVDSADNGIEAINKIDTSNYDCIFLDLAMPGIDGIETLKQIMHKNPDMQVFLLTGQATLQKGIEAIKYGAKDVLEKPVDIKMLVKRIVAAQADRMVIMQSNIEDKIQDILKEKGW